MKCPRCESDWIEVCYYAGHYYGQWNCVECKECEL